MPWITVEQAARERRTSTRHIWRLIKEEKLTAQSGSDGPTVVWSDAEIAEESAEFTLGPVELPVVQSSRVTPELRSKVSAMIESIQFRDDICAQEEQLAFRSGLPAKTQQRYKAEVRRLFRLPTSVPLIAIATHGQIQQALEFVISPKKRDDHGELRSARGMIVVKGTGEYHPVNDWLLALFAWENHNAVSCYRSLLTECRTGRVIYERGGSVVLPEDLPSERAVSRWLHSQTETNLAVRRARMTKSRWEASEQMYASSNPEDYRVGGRLMGDHTELDTLIYRNDGRVAPLWLTAWIDYRSGLLKGYELAYRPNSDTIALAFKRAVTGKQLAVCTGDGKFMPASIIDAPDVATVDNGRDYRSKYTKQVFGKVDLTDEARQTIQRVTRLHYALKHHPQSKAQQERFFGVIQEITKYMPGYKGAKYQDKPDELQAQLKRGELLTEDQFRKLFARAIDAYNNRPKRLLDNMSPMEFTLTHQGTQRHVEERVMDFLMMKVSNRTINRGQVRHLGLEFYSRDLLVHNGKRAVLYYDPADIGMVAVYVDGEFVTVAVNKKHFGQDERSWLALLKERSKIDKQAAQDLITIRKGLTSDEAKAMLWNGELGSARAVPPELLQRHTPAVVVMTGIETESTAVKEHIEKRKQIEEAEKKQRDLIKKQPLSVINIGKLK